MPKNNEYDLVVIGGGPGGYRSAEWAGARGRRVLLAESNAVGGVCLNTGCIPTKTLLHAAKTYHAVANGAKIGVAAPNVRFDMAGAMAHKDKTVATLTKGVGGTLGKKGVEIVSDKASLVDHRTVRVGTETVTADNVILATGSTSFVPPVPGIDSPAVLTSTELLAIDSIPDSITIIGGGYIGMEFASFFHLIGVKVTVIEMMPEIIPFVDPDFAKNLRRQLKGVEFHLGSRVTKVDGNAVHFTDDSGAEQSIEAEIILASLGRRPQVSTAGYAEAGLDFDKSGVRVNETQKTNLPGVYGVGDVTGKSLLAHSAYRMAEVAVEDMFPIGGAWNRMRYTAVPWVVFTAPELAGCGLTESQAAEQGIPVQVASLPMAASGRYLAEHPGERGTIKVIADGRTGRVVGGTIIGSGASEVAFGLALAIEQELRIQDVRETIFPHPTVSEVFRDVMWEFAD